MCIYGGSYGGYAAMWALAKTPDLFRCGISFAGVSDLTYMFRDSSDNNDYAASREYMRMLVGDPDASRQQFDEVSPLKNAARIKSPIFIAHGNRDGRVPIDHSEKMIDALKENGKQYEWMELNREGHGIGNDENRLKFYNALFKFLDRNIGEGSKAK